MNKIIFEFVPEVKQWVSLRPLWQRALLVIVLVGLGVGSLFKEQFNAFAEALLISIPVALPIWAWIVIVCVGVLWPSLIIYNRISNKQRVYRNFCIVWNEYSENLRMIQMYWDAHYEIPSLGLSQENRANYQNLSGEYAARGHALREKVKFLLSAMDRFKDNFSYFDGIWKTFTEAHPKFKRHYPTPFHFLTDNINPIPMLSRMTDEWQEADYIANQYIEEIKNRNYSLTYRFKEIEKRNEDLRSHTKSVLKEIELGNI